MVVVVVVREGGAGGGWERNTCSRHNQPGSSEGWQQMAGSVGANGVICQCNCCCVSAGAVTLQHASHDAKTRVEGLAEPVLLMLP